MTSTTKTSYEDLSTFSLVNEKFSHCSFLRVYTVFYLCASIEFTLSDSFSMKRTDFKVQKLLSTMIVFVENFNVHIFIGTYVWEMIRKKKENFSNSDTMAKYGSPIILATSRQKRFFGSLIVCRYTQEPSDKS